MEAEEEQKEIELQNISENKSNSSEEEKSDTQSSQSQTTTSSDDEEEEASQQPDKYQTALLKKLEKERKYPDTNLPVFWSFLFFLLLIVLPQLVLAKFELVQQILKYFQKKPLLYVDFLPGDFSDRQLKKFSLNNGIRVMMVSDPLSLSGISLRINFQGQPQNNGYKNFESDEEILRNPYFVGNDYPPGISSLFLQVLNTENQKELLEIYSNFSGIGSSTLGSNHISFKTQLSSQGVSDYLKILGKLTTPLLKKETLISVLDSAPLQEAIIDDEQRERNAIFMASNQDSMFSKAGSFKYTSAWA